MTAAVQAPAEGATYVRKVRHWKMRFREGAAMRVRRPMRYNGVDLRPGDPVPEHLAKSDIKLRRFWRSGFIELAEFDDPRDARAGGREAAPPAARTADDPLAGAEVLERGSWRMVKLPDGRTFKANGQKAFDDLKADLAKELRQAEEEAASAAAAAVDADLGEQGASQGDTGEPQGSSEAEGEQAGSEAETDATGDQGDDWLDEGDEGEEGEAETETDPLA